MVIRKKFIIALCILLIFITIIIFAQHIYMKKSNYTSYNKSIDEGNITAESIANCSDKSKYYGKIVTNYACANSGGVNAWKILYADNDNIYLIADDYISYEYCPQSATQSVVKSEKLITHDNGYMLKITEVMKDYSGMNDITNQKLKSLNEDYFNERSYSESNSMKASAYMLDTNIWRVFAGDKAEYAIGCPTIELMLKSYSQKYGVNYQAESDEIGYRVSNDGGKTWDANAIHMLNNEDSLYVINSDYKAYSLWLASPSCYGQDYILTIGNNGTVGLDTCGSNMNGFRPVVCLKTGTALEKQSEDEYRIK